MNGAETLELLLRGLAVGAQVAFGLALARSARDVALRFATILFILSNLAFVLNGDAPVRQLLGPFTHVLWLVQIGGGGAFWLFAAVLFEDRRLLPAALAPFAGLILIGLIAQFSPAGISAPLWTLHNLVGLALAAHAMLLIVRSGRVDLIEERRRLRVPFLGIVSGYAVLISLVQIGMIAGINSRWYGLVDAGLQAALGLLGATVLLEARAVLFGVAVPAADLPAHSPDADAPWLQRLAQVIERDALWRREALTIGELAAAVGLPEHRLRRLINDRLGHRNFPSFINGMRIDAAKAMLVAPDSAGRTIAAIAFDLGFGSLGPFNRAFRDATGLTPTEYRRTKSAQSSPIPENSG